MSESDPGEHEFLLAELSRINSELVTSQRAAHRATAEVSAVREREKRFVSMVAHDLSNPLQVVIGFAEVLLGDDSLSPTQRSAVERISRSADLMRTLVADLSQGFDENSEPELLLRPVRLDELAESVVGRHQLLSGDKNLHLTFACDRPDRRECTVLGDVGKLERVLNNLVGNAVKYSPPGSTIRVTVTVEDGAVVTQVRDEGPGIPPDGLERIFEPFHREEATSDLPGVGLGLYISRRIAEQQGGTIAVESTPGAGATFSLALPVAEEAARGRTA